jgi:hypothetical protein
MRGSAIGSLVTIPLVAAALAGARAPEPSPATTYRAVVREYQDAQQAFFKALGAARTDAERRKALARKPNPADYAERFLELARQHPADPASFDALNWILTYSTRGPAADDAIERLAADHMASPRLGPALQRLAASQSRAAEGLLREAMAKNPSREVQAQACYGLASLLAARARRPAPAKDEVVVEDEKDEPKADAVPPRDEARALFEQLGAKYGGLKVGRKKTYNDLARAGLARLDPTARRPPSLADPDGPEVGLEVGMTAPEIEGLDVNGRPMRLSAFRGKVVVLDFWGDW